MKTLVYWLAVLLQVYLLVFTARFVMSLILAFTQYRPTGAAAVAFEFVYTVTDPPLKALRRVIPDLRMGNFALDLSFIVVVIVLQIVAGQLFAISGGR